MISLLRGGGGRPCLLRGPPSLICLERLLSVQFSGASAFLSIATFPVFDEGRMAFGCFWCCRRRCFWRLREKTKTETRRERKQRPKVPEPDKVLPTYVALTDWHHLRKHQPPPAGPLPTTASVAVAVLLIDGRQHQRKRERESCGSGGTWMEVEP